MDKDMDKKLDELCELKEQMIDWIGTYIKSGPDHIDIKELGEAVDIVKDFAETEKYCREACYYKTVTEAMEEESEMEEGRFGYNRSHMSNGQFASKGRGTMYGYRPMVDQEPYVDAYLHDPNFARNMRMGYREMVGNNYDQNNSRYGASYNNYREAKKHYTQTNSASDKAEMETFSNEHLADVSTTLREMWKDADPNLRKRMKAELTGLVGEMTI